MNRFNYLVLCLLVSFYSVSAVSLDLYPKEGKEYTQLKFKDADGNIMLYQACHIYTNPKLDESGRMVQYRHKHCTFYVLNDEGERVHVFNITFGRARPQFQFYYDVVFKEEGAAIILRSDTGKVFWRLAVDEEGVISTVKMPRGFIHKANVDPIFEGG